MTTYTISPGQTSNGITLNSGDIENDYGKTNSSTINGGAAYIFSGGTASATTVNNGGLDIVYSGGEETGAVVNSGGSQWIGTDP